MAAPPNPNPDPAPQLSPSPPPSPSPSLFLFSSLASSCSSGDERGARNGRVWAWSLLQPGESGMVMEGRRCMRCRWGRRSILHHHRIAMSCRSGRGWRCRRERWVERWRIKRSSVQVGGGAEGGMVALEKNYHITFRINVYVWSYHIGLRLGRTKKRRLPE